MSVTPTRCAAAILAAGMLAAVAAVVFGSGVASSAAGGVRLQTVGHFASPLDVAAPPGDPHHIYVVEQAGRVRVVTDGHTQSRPFLDITRLVTSGDERGLLSIAFPPNYTTTHHFYVYYTGRPPAVGHEGDIELDRFTATSATRANPSSRVRVLTIAHHAQANHNGGQLQFGPDGLLYFGTGDGGGGGDTQGNGQNLTRTSSNGGADNHSPLLAKMLRIAPSDGPEGGYTVPASNPFPAPARPVWMLGLRNPWRWSFDAETGDMIIGDVGQDRYEEIDFVPAAGADMVGGRGDNFGWNLREGFHRYSPTSETPGPNFATPPVIEQPHSAGWLAIIGGYVVRDHQLGSLYGTYLYGDNAKSQLWGARLSAGKASDNRYLGISVPQLAGFGEDACDRVYVALLGGTVARLVPASGRSTCSVAQARGS